MFSAEHEAICFFSDPSSDLKAIIAIHSTLLGPALGGTRIFPYRNEEDAMADVCALSKAMTYKAAAADLPFGGGKAVILADWNDPEKQKKLKAFCRFVNVFNGTFQTGEDLGTTTEDILYMRKFTRYAHCTLPDVPDYLQTSALTARGVLRGIEASLEHCFGSPELKGRHILIQGLGKVGSRLARLLRENDARLTVTDLNAALALNTSQALECERTRPEEIYSVEADVFCPCASGRILNERTLPQLKTPIVTGCANNQLSDNSFASLMHQRGILYTPDYVVNAGGLMSATLEMGIEDETTMMQRVDGIRTRLLWIYAEAKREDCPPLEIVDRLVVRKLADAARKEL